MPIRSWGAFLLLGLVWGSSFLWIKLALTELGPFTLVAFRLLFGAFGMAIVLWFRRPPFPRDTKTLSLLALMGLTNTALPFTLISWGQTSIDSGVASILNSTTPLFTLVIAHFFLEDERMNLPRAIGLLVGFIGILLLFSRDVGAEGFRSSVLGQAAVVAAAISYAGSSVFAPHLDWSPHLRSPHPHTKPADHVALSGLSRFARLLPGVPLILLSFNE
jgi:drug/metabolite transporter (DMT)-like permease